MLDETKLCHAALATSYMAHLLRKVERFKDQDWKAAAKAAMVRLPRVVPMKALHITNPLGPQPFKLDLPSRESGRTITLFVFVPHVTSPHTKPEKANAVSYTFPVVMDYHGGGFYLGGPLEQAPFCSMLCRELHAVVIGVDYRLSPPDPFPAAIEDAEDVVSAVLDLESPGYDQLRSSIANVLTRRWNRNVYTKEKREEGKVPPPSQPEVRLDNSRIALSGASSGGNIALNVVLSVPASHGLPEWPSRVPADYATQIPLLLLYPSLDLRQLPSERYRHEAMPSPNNRKMKWLDIDDHLSKTYVDRETAGHPRASPGLVDVGVGLHQEAKILLILSGLDTLWEQSKTWCWQVVAQGRGKDMRVMRYNDRKHGWTQIPAIALSKEERNARMEVLNECVRFARAVWRGEDAVTVLRGGDVQAQSNPGMRHHDIK